MNLRNLRKLAGLTEMHVEMPSQPEMQTPGGPAQTMSAEMPLMDQKSMVLILSNDQLCQYLMALGLDVERSDAGSRALVPADTCDTYKSAFSEMGFCEEDYQFQDDFESGYSKGHEHEKLGGYGDPYFPDGEDGQPRDQSKMGPAAAKGGSNPMNFRENRELYDQLSESYKKFKVDESKKKERITARKHEGDDAYSWAVFIDGRPAYTGLGRSEVPHYKKLAAKHLADRDAKAAGSPPQS